MCGIAGIIHPQRAHPVDRQLLVNMAAIQAHRGPDGFGVQTFEDHGVGFSHARLSIIDLNASRGRQPFVSADGRLLLAHNGEFYDYQRIRARSSAGGSVFTTRSDSEIILHLYPELGVRGMLPHLRGEFAFALYDREEEALYLVRDRFGIKPLYYTRTPAGAVVFGSELKVLFAHPEVPRAFSSEGLYHQLMQTMVPGTTAFQGIEAVQPGCGVRITRRDGRLDIQDFRYWDMDFPRQADREPMDADAAIEGTREGLLDAVAHRMEADVPVGAYLSGGIDSCAILGLAAAISQQPVRAFTIGFDDAAYDESPIAAQMAARTGAEQDVLRLTGAELYDHFEETLWHTERTIYNTLGVAKLLMSRHVNQSNYRVVMTGEGSDELFGGYPAFRRDMFLHGLEDMPAEERARWQDDLTRSNALFQGAMLAREAVEAPSLTARVGFTPSCLQPWLACGTLVPALLDPDRASDLRGYDPAEAIAQTLDVSQLEGRHALDRAQYVWSKTMLEGQILTWGGDRVDMANSMEARPAFLDHHLAAWAVRIPPEYRIRGQTEKWVLREAMKGVLPEVLYRREKFAFMAPPAHTDEGKWARMKQLADRHLTADRIRETGLLSVDGVMQFMARHGHPDTSGAERVQMDAVVNHLLCVQILHDHFVAADVPAQARARAEALGWTVEAAGLA